MSDPGNRQQNTHHDSRPGEAADRSEQSAVQDTFPASDPVAPTAAVGSRAVAPERMMQETGGAPPPADAVSFTARFRDREAAKLAVETLVREGPIDRRGAEITSEGDKASLRVSAPRTDAERLKSLLERSPEAQ